MKRKISLSLIIGLILLILTISILQIMQIFGTIIFASHVLLCSKQDKIIISNAAGINEQFYLAFYTEGLHGNSKTAKVKDIFGNETIIEENTGYTIGSICQYIQEHDNADYALIVCEIPYLIVCIICIIVLFKILLPMYSDTKKD